MNTWYIVQVKMIGAACVLDSRWVDNNTVYKRDGKPE